MRIHALWCHPRSMSTAVERIMRERGDLEVFHEPFMYDYYIGGERKKFAGFEPEAGHPTTYEGIRELVRAKSAWHPVFIKDMAYYVVEKLPDDPDFAHQVFHAFLVRDPVQSILSYVKRQKDFSLEEVGLEAQWRLYQKLRKLGCKTHILLAEDIRQDPVAAMNAYWKAGRLPDRPNAMSWDASVPRDWRSVETWHSEVIETRSITPPDETRNYASELYDLGAPYTGFYAYHRPFFDKLVEAARHQK
ncbi:MAG: hypothetical protein AAFU69_02980 [Pseudomonadota bacterium]